MSTALVDPVFLNSASAFWRDELDIPSTTQGPDTVKVLPSNPHSDFPHAHFSGSRRILITYIHSQHNIAFTGPLFLEPGGTVALNSTASL